MRNISYFCIVKRLNCLFKSFFLCVAVLMSWGTHAQNVSDSLLARMDSVDVALITCGPGSEIWSEFGHTAIRITDRANGEDIAVNYGMFSFHQPHFIPRFVLGKTDYQMGIQPFDEFLQEYIDEKRYVIQQPLNLSSSDKMHLLQALETNYRPENRVYRYNFFYDNCTTRARDVIIGNCNSKVTFRSFSGRSKSYRKLVHEMNAPYPWTRFGEDLLLGCDADKICTDDQRQFLPLYLMSDFQNAVIADSIDTEGWRPLVSNTYYILPPKGLTTEAKVDFSSLINTKGNSFSADNDPEVFTPSIVFLLLFFVTAALCIIEWCTRKHLWGFDAMLYTVCGIAGLILLAMVFSEHPTVQCNFQIFILSPLWLVSLWPLIHYCRQKNIRLYAVWSGIMLICIISGLVLGYASSQQFAEGMYLLTLSLIIRLAMPLFFHAATTRMGHEPKGHMA